MGIYLGTFLIALATLALEVTLTRLLSVITWYHLSFFAISTAMLGMTAGAVTVYLRRGRFSGERLGASLARACLGFALVVPVCLVVLNMIPLGFQRAGVTVVSVAAFAVATVACSLPFYFSGMAVTAVLTLSREPIGRIYATDLVGAATGCLLVLGGLELLDAPSLILFCAALGGLAALGFAGRSRRALGYAGLALFVLLAAAVHFNSGSPRGIRPYVVKERVVDPNRILLERWNSYSRVVVDRPTVGPPQYWGPSPEAPREPISQLWMRIDGEAGTAVRPFSTRDDIRHLAFDVTNVAYYLRPEGGACVIGVGGGRDLQSALLFGHERVTGIEVNRIFVDLLRTTFSEFAGLAGRDEVRFVVDEARSYLARSRESFSLIQMSLIDTWAATGAGAFSFTENALYTVEAWQVFLDRLDDDGLFTVSRWHDPDNPGETGRAVSLAVTALFEAGAERPAGHVAMVTAGNISTLIVGRRPLSDEDVETLERVSEDLGYEVTFRPGRLPAPGVLRDIVVAASPAELEAAVASRPLDYSAPTDESPYFFNMLRLGHLDAARGADGGVVRGNLVATITLLVLMGALAGLSFLTVLGPLLARSRSGGGLRRRLAGTWPGMLYFALIGAGFMLVEIGLIQRLSLFLGHPVYALGILLFTIILSAGAGSFLSERLPARGRGATFLYPLLATAAILAGSYGLSALVEEMITSSMGWRIGVSVAAIVPLGLVLGLFFPIGMRLAEPENEEETPWYWALNGIFGVLASVLAVFLAIYAGISVNFVAGALCYLALLVPLASMVRPSPDAPGGPTRRERRLATPQEPAAAPASSGGLGAGIPR